MACRVENHVVDRERPFPDIPVADEMKGSILPGAMATSTILVNERGDVFVEGDLGGAGQQRRKD